jgi:hypothetical protein
LRIALVDLPRCLVVEWVKKGMMRRRFVAAGASCGCSEAGDCGAVIIVYGVLSACEGKLLSDLVPLRGHLGHRCER